MSYKHLAVFILLVLSQQMFAAGGTVAGRVTSKGDGEALVGATVLLQGTVRGTTTNVKGEYRIAEVPAGTYTLIFSMVGYQREVRTSVALEEGKETRVDVALTQTPVQTEQIVVTASKREQSFQEVPVSVSVLEAAQIQQRNSLTVEDALRYVPGVNITGGQVNIRGSSGYSRGAGSRVLMLLDGIPFIAGDTGELNFESIPVGMVDRIEVVKGASSALYGSSALGGVINVITKPIPEVPETFVRTYAGLYNKPSFSQWRWSSKNRWVNGQSVSHALRSGNLGVAMYFSRQLDDGYRMNDYRRRYNFYLKTREDFSHTNSLTLNFGLLYQYGGQFLYWRNLDSALIPPVIQQSDNVKSMRYYASGQYSGVFTEKFLFRTRFLWYHNDWGYETINAVGRTESLSDMLDLELQGTLMVNDMHTLTFGAEGEYDMVTADLFGRHKLGGFALYGQDEIALVKDVVLTLGARFDFQSLGLTKASGQLNPKAALTYSPLSGTTLRASFGKGYRVPSVAEAFITGEVSNLAVVPNKDMKPEQSYSYETGISQTLWDIGTIDAALFRSDYTNLIEAGLIVSPSNLPQIQWRNVTKARVQGYETSLRLGLFNGALQASTSYTYVYPQDRTQGDILKYRPRHLFYANATGRIGPFLAGADFRYVSRVERIDVELVNLGIIQNGDARTDIVVADFRIGADLSTFTGLPVRAMLNVNNAFQRNYVELIGNLMPPRTYVLTLEGHF